MEDPRDQVIISEDELTADEDEALLDLQKEYELKKQQLLEKKKRDQTAQHKFLKGVSTTPVVKDINYSKRVFSFEVGKPCEYACSEDDIDMFTKSRLRKRYYPDSVVYDFINKHEVKVLNVNKALAKIVKPDFKEPLYDNWVYVGVVVEKSMLKTKNGDGYLKLRVGTFERSISINLFEGAGKKHRTMIPGELIMVLNPNIHGNGQTFVFSNRDDDNNIISLGLIKDIQRCGDPKCEKYISTKFTYCEFHESKQEQKFLKNKRMELNGSVKMLNPLHKQKTYNEDSNFYTVKSQFDSRKYDQATMFQNQGSKRKLQDEKANEKLESKLTKLASAKFERIGLVKAPKPDSVQVKKKTDLVKELKSLTENKKVNLKMSKKDKLNKRTKWNENLTQLNNGVSKQPMAKGQNGSTSKLDSIDNKRKFMQPYLPVKNAKMFEEFELSDDDDDLNISFSEAQMNQYKRITK